MPLLFPDSFRAAGARIVFLLALLALPSFASAQTFIVSPDKSHGQFTTVMAAIDSIPRHSKAPVTILIRPGIYHEHIVIPENEPPITLLGENPNNTILGYSFTTVRLKMIATLVSCLYYAGFAVM